MTPQNLEAIHDGTATGDMPERGYFAFWRESVSRPPFEPPLDVLCQIYGFPDAVTADAWLAGGMEHPRWLAGVYRVPSDGHIEASPNREGVRLTVRDSDDAPLAIGRILVRGAMAHVIFVGSTQPLPADSAAGALLDEIASNAPAGAAEQPDGG